MSYEKQTWNKYDELKTEEENIENGAVVTDNRMNHMESGIGDNDTNIASHLADKNNPHKVTAAQVGLDKVDNVKQASKVDFDSHTSDNSNPHKVTAAQIGLDKVDNVQQAAKTDFDSHVNNKANPHAVTAFQVGAYTKTESDSKLTDLSNKVILNKGNIVSGTDLNNVTETGFYRIGGLIGGTDILNVPSELSGLNFYAFLTVTGSLQELTVYSPKQDTTWTYSRSVSGSSATWSSWSKTVMADDSGKVKVNDLEVSGTIKRINDIEWTSLGNFTSIKREGDTVTVKVVNATRTTAGDIILGTIPIEHRPVDSVMTLVPAWSVGTTNDKHVQLNGSSMAGPGGMTILSAAANTQYTFQFKYEI